MKKLFSVLLGTTMLGGVSFAQADEIKPLSDSELDTVTAGLTLAATGTWAVGISGGSKVSSAGAVDYHSTLLLGPDDAASASGSIAAAGVGGMVLIFP